MNTEPTKEVRHWNGIPLNITTKAGESRFEFAPPMTCDYGCIRGSWGVGLDGKALDVYVVSDKPTVFKVTQVTKDGGIDEYKYILGAKNFDHAVDIFLRHVPSRLFGFAMPYSIERLQSDINNKITKDSKISDNILFFITQIEQLLEDDEAYGSDVELLKYSIRDNDDITGFFRDAWNNRTFSFSIESDQVGYKPAVTTNSAIKFDSFSAGYCERLDAPARRSKKPKCTNISYGCGRSCISLMKTCWIRTSGAKVKKSASSRGAVASISQGRIDKLRELASQLKLNPESKNWVKRGSASLLEIKAKKLEDERNKLFKKPEQITLPATPVPVAKVDIVDEIMAAKGKLQTGQEVAELLGRAYYEYYTITRNISDLDRKIVEETKSTFFNEDSSRTFVEWYKKDHDREVAKQLKMLTAARDLLKVEQPSSLNIESTAIINPVSGKQKGSLTAAMFGVVNEGLQAFKEYVGVNTLKNRPVKIFEMEGKSSKAKRAFATPTTGEIYLSPNNTASVVIHELGHILEENDAAMHKKVEAFIAKRTQGEKYEKLSKITGDKGYNSSEVTLKDHWVHPYMGKKIHGTNSEMISVGLELFHRNPIEFATKDPECFAFIYNTVRGK